MTAAIISAIIAAVAAIAGGVASYSATKKTNEANQANYEDWKSYNTPANQMQRLEDAGLNKYLVSNVTNTLSQPYQVGNNQGIAEMLGNLSNVSAQGGNAYINAQNLKAQQQLAQQRIDNQKKQLELNSIGMSIKQKLADINLKIGDYRAALLATQGKIAGVNYDYLNRTLPYRVGTSFYDYLMKQQTYGFNELLNPLKLQFYSPMQRAQINALNARSHYLNFMEGFNRQQLMKDYYFGSKNYNLKELMFENSVQQFYDRLSLSNQYYDLARNKWLTDIFFRGVDTAMDFLPMGRIGKAAKSAKSFVPWSSTSYSH